MITTNDIHYVYEIDTLQSNCYYCLHPSGVHSVMLPWIDNITAIASDRSKIDIYCYANSIFTIANLSTHILVRLQSCNA